MISDAAAGTMMQPTIASRLGEGGSSFAISRERVAQYELDLLRLDVRLAYGHGSDLVRHSILAFPSFAHSSPVNLRSHWLP